MARCAFLFAIVLTAFTQLAMPQSSHSARQIVVNGHTGETVIYEIDGRYFVELDSLASISNGSIKVDKQQIVLTIPALPENNTRSAATQTGSHVSILSPDFMKAAIEDVSLIKEWANVMANAVQRGMPGDGSNLLMFRDRAANGLQLAKVSATTEGDESGMVLLTNQFTRVNEWTDKLIRERKAMDTGKYSVNESGLSRDDTYQKIVNCGNFLGTMLTSGDFHDDRLCH